MVLPPSHSGREQRRTLWLPLGVSMGPVSLIAPCSFATMCSNVRRWRADIVKIIELVLKRWFGPLSTWYCRRRIRTGVAQGATAAAGGPKALPLDCASLFRHNMLFCWNMAPASSREGLSRTVRASRRERAGRGCRCRLVSKGALPSCYASPRSFAVIYSSIGL